MASQQLTDLVGTEWTGKGELWLDSEGNKADLCECALRVEAGQVRYTWSYEGQTKEGSFTFTEGGATWVDSWHQSEPMKCADVPDAWGLFAIESTYEVPDNPAWGWRTILSQRPDGDLVLQMVNLAPWGEEGRAVRMTFTRVGS